MIDHDERREKELQLLVSGVLATTGEWYNSYNGADEFYCPLCYERFRYLKIKREENMENIEHKMDCPYFIAKGLKT